MASPTAMDIVDAGKEVSTENHSSSSTAQTVLSPVGTPASNPHSKPCTLCKRPRDVLIRCQIDETKKWHFVCTGKCWQQVSGGKTDGETTHPLYRYGGMWKNKHDAVSAKIKGKAKEANKDIWNGMPGPHRRRGIKAWSKRAGKASGRLGDMKIQDDDGGSDIEVSELDDDDDECDGGLPHGFEKGETDGKVAEMESQV